MFRPPFQAGAVSFGILQQRNNALQACRASQHRENKHENPEMFRFGIGFVFGFRTKFSRQLPPWTGRCRSLVNPDTVPNSFRILPDFCPGEGRVCAKQYLTELRGIPLDSMHFDHGHATERCPKCRLQPSAYRFKSFT